MFLSAALGGVIGSFLQKDNSKRVLSTFLPFSGAFLLGVAVLHIIPEIYHGVDGFSYLSVFILLGFLIQIILESFSQGIEHGHIHIHKGHHNYVIPIMLGLCLHAFIEGMPVSSIGVIHEGHNHGSYFQPYVWGIAIHKLPAAIALSVLMLYSGMKKRMMFLMIFLFALMSPLGSLVMNSFEVSEFVEKAILGIAVGSILHVATIIIFETDERSGHKISYKKLVAVLLGFSMAIITIL